MLDRLESQVLVGDGTGANLTGIFNTAGIGTAASGSGDTTCDTLLNGKRTLVTALKGRQPELIVLNGADLDKIAKTKGTTNERPEINGGPVDLTNQTIWGIPYFESPITVQGTALVANFSMSCVLYIREGRTLRISDSDQDDFVRNKVTLLAETRVALAVRNPVGVVKVTTLGN